MRDRIFPNKYELYDFVYFIGEDKLKVRRSRIKQIKIIISEPYKVFSEEFDKIIRVGGLEIYYLVGGRSDEDHIYRDWLKEEYLYKKKNDVPL